MAWIVLVAAGLLEIGWAIGLKHSAGFTRLVPTALTLLSMAASIALLGVALKTLPLGTAYAIWTGIGALGTVVIGILFFGEDASLPRLLCIALILVGLIGLKVTSPH